MSLRIEQDEINRLVNRLLPTSQQLSDVAFFMRQQVDDRFRSQGASGGVPWPPKQMRKWGYNDGRAILTGPKATLRHSFVAVGTDTQAIVGSWVPYSVIHQLGTIGKGGVRPTIVPKTAKALFIPITDKAINAVRLTGKEAGSARILHKIAATTEKTLLAPYRVGIKESKKTRTTSFVRLVRGRLYKGRLQKWDDKKKEFVDGTPDFIFLRRVDIPPRPMLPVSPQELRATGQFFAKRLLK